MYFAPVSEYQAGISADDKEMETTGTASGKNTSTGPGTKLEPFLQIKCALPHAFAHVTRRVN